MTLQNIHTDINDKQSHSDDGDGSGEAYSALANRLHACLICMAICREKNLEDRMAEEDRDSLTHSFKVAKLNGLWYHPNRFLHQSVRTLDNTVPAATSE